MHPPRDPLARNTVLFCHLLGVKHSHRAMPATVTHDHAAYGASKLVSRHRLIFQGCVEVAQRDQTKDY